MRTYTIATGTDPRGAVQGVTVKGSQIVVDGDENLIVVDTSGNKVAIFSRGGWLHAIDLDHSK